MKREDRRYIQKRSALLSDKDRRAIESRGQAASLLERGIGGIADLRRLKCLHLHVAHELADENPVGAIVRGMLSATECGPKEVICSALVSGGADPSDRIDR